MRGLALVALSLLLLAGCAHDDAGAPAVTSTATPTPVQSLSAGIDLPFDDSGGLSLLGVCWGYGSTGDPSELSRFDITVPAKIDGISVRIAFPLRVDESSRMLDDKGVSLTRHEQYLLLDRDAGDSEWAVRAHRLDAGRLALNLATAQRGAIPAPTETAPKVVRSLTLNGVLPFGSDDSFDLTGDVTGGEGAGSAQGMKLIALDFRVPMRIDGVDVDVTVPVVVDDRTRMYDEEGDVVPRLEQDRYEDSNFRPWIATVRKQGDELVAVELRVLTVAIQERPSVGGSRAEQVHQPVAHKRCGSRLGPQRAQVMHPTLDRTTSGCPRHRVFTLDVIHV